MEAGPDPTLSQEAVESFEVFDNEEVPQDDEEVPQDSEEFQEDEEVQALYAGGGM